MKKVEIFKIIKNTAGGFHSWVESSVGIIRKQNSKIFLEEIKKPIVEKPVEKLAKELDKEFLLNYSEFRKGWRSLFRFEVGIKLYDLEIVLPKYYKKTHFLIEKNVDIYWVIPLNYIVVLLVFIRRQWFSLARFCYKKGLLNKPREGEKISWFWLKYLKVGKIKKS